MFYLKILQNGEIKTLSEWSEKKPGLNIVLYGKDILKGYLLMKF